METKMAETNSTNNKIRKSVAVKLDSEGQFIDNKTGETINPIETIKNTDLYVVEASNEKVIEKLATGVAIPTYRKKSWDYLNEINDFGEIVESDIYKYIEVSDKLYRFEPIIGTALDLFVDFAITDISLETENEDLKNIFDYLYNNVNSPVHSTDYTFSYPTGIVSLMHEIALEWFISGNVFPFTEWEKTPLPINNKAFNLPIRIVNLNPRSIKISRSDSILGAETIFYNPGVIYGSDKKGTTINDANTINKGNSGETLSNILLSKKEAPINNNYVYHIKRRASSFRLWGIPYLTKTFISVKAKNKLRYLDEATIDGLANFIAIFKIGSTDKDSPYHKVNGDRITAFKQLISNPQASNMLVWPHDIDVITVGPEGKVLSFDKKYQTVDNDIIKSLGIPTPLLDGTGGNSAVTWISILALVERLETLRKSIENYMLYLVKQIAKANGIKYQKASISWRPTNLRDEKTIKTLLLAFYDRGLLPKETALFQGGYDYDNILNLKKQELKDNIDKYFVRPDVPFSPSPTNPLKKFGSEGRPVDTVNTKITANSMIEESTMPFTKMKKSIDDRRKLLKNNAEVVADTFLENVESILLRTLHEVVGVNHIKKAEVNKAFAQIQHYQDIFINTEITFNTTDQISVATLKTFAEWRVNYVENIKEYFNSVLSGEFKYARKQSKNYEYAARGFVMDVSDKFCAFYLNCLDVISILGNVDVGNNINVTINNEEYKNISTADFFKKLPFGSLEEIIFN